MGKSAWRPPTPEFGPDTARCPGLILIIEPLWQRAGPYLARNHEQVSFGALSAGFLCFARRHCALAHGLARLSIAGVSPDQPPQPIAPEAIDAALARISLLSQSAGRIAHDFNNLLAAISGSADLLQMGGTDPARHIRNIQNAAKRGSDLMGQLLALSPRLDGAISPVDPAQLLADLRASTSDLLGTTHLLSTFATPELGTVPLDHAQMLNALRCLIENARDAMPAGGTILITAQSIGASETAFSVHDTGTGITPEVQPRIFEPFFTTKPKDQGLGLGLPVVLRIVHRHGGRILVRSEPGQGTVVTCIFPRDTAAAD